MNEQTTARWQEFTQLIIGRQPGDIITYQEMRERVTGFDITRDRGAILKAAQHLLETDERTLACVRSVGYRITRADDHVELARGKQREARRKVRKARHIAEHYNRSEASPETAARLDQMALTLANHESMLRTISKRQERQAQALADTTTTVEQTSEQVARIEAALIRAGLLNKRGAA